MHRDRALCPTEDPVAWLDAPVAELSLLLPGPQVAALDRLARARGLTVGQLIRRVIHDYLVGRNSSGPVGNGQEPGDDGSAGSERSVIRSSLSGLHLRIKQLRGGGPSTGK